jgi:membrane protease YdiL (CAAX protease family)
MGSEKLRARLEKLPNPAIALSLTVAAVLPYCLATLAFGTFQWQGFGAIAGLAAVVAFWYVLLPKKPFADVLLLILICAVVLAKIFPRWYASTHPKLQLEILGQLMWFRTGILAILSVRRAKGIGFGFWPSRREWTIGALYFLAFIPLAALVSSAIGFASPRVPTQGWEKTSIAAVATFCGILWVVALGEEFFFRGLLQQWLSAWLHSDWRGIAAASALFGSVHLWFRKFPNWRFAVLAALAGIVYGLAFRKAKSIRASMVTHALVVTAWRILFA